MLNLSTSAIARPDPPECGLMLRRAVPERGGSFFLEPERLAGVLAGQDWKPRLALGNRGRGELAVEDPHLDQIGLVARLESVRRELLPHAARDVGHYRASFAVAR